MFFQVMREYTSKVDKLEEAEKLRAEEVKEENNKPIVMGELKYKTFKYNDLPKVHQWHADHSLGVHVAAVVLVLVTAR